LRPDLAIGWYLAGLAAEGEHHLDDAQKSFEHALQIQPGAFDVLSALAQLDLARGRLPDAIERTRQVVTRDPQNTAAANLLGELYMKANDLPAAIAALNGALKAAPQWWIPYRNLAIAKYAAKDVTGAEAAYRAGSAVAPDEMQLVTELALMYQDRGHVDDAIACYEAWNRSHPKDNRGVNNLAMLLVSYKKDRISLDRARDLAASFADARDPHLLDTNGWVHFKRGEYPQALTALRRAAEGEPGAKEIHYHLGMAELQAGRKDSARTELETALSGKANFTGSDEARIALASLKSSAT
jgi:Flp pilus assembly protein TadD